MGVAESSRPTAFCRGRKIDAVCTVDGDYIDENLEIWNKSFKSTDKPTE